LSGTPVGHEIFHHVVSAPCRNSWIADISEQDSPRTPESIQPLLSNLRREEPEKDESDRTTAFHRDIRVVAGLQHFIDPEI
jgi:hypothetical protein